MSDPPRMPPSVQSSRREPLLAGVFAHQPGTDVPQCMQQWAASVAKRVRKLAFGGGANVDGAVSHFDGGGTVAANKSSFCAGGWSTLVLSAPGERSRAKIMLSIDGAHVEIAVELPVAEMRTARASFADPARALELSSALDALPEQFAVGLMGDDARLPASLTLTELQGILARGEREQRALWLGWSIPRDVAFAHAALLDEQLEDAAVALGSIFAILAELPDSRRALDGPPGSTKHGHRDDRLRAARPTKHAATRDGEDSATRARLKRGQHLDRRPRNGEIEADGDIPENEDPPRPQGARPITSAAPRARTGRTRSPPIGMERLLPRGKPVIEKGAHVRFLEGPFSGKVGIVQELDSKGGARVLLGLLAVRVHVKDLARCAETGRNRPVLSTSHRKHVPVRS
ncbi:MAG: KOW motif-containing protein [Myxococcota bacterium]|nr:KOW motif-containing protein [Myxococcota bacterium]